MGQTGRKDIVEHRNHLRKNITHFIIIEYRCSCNHEFDWNRVEILGKTFNI